MIVVCPSRRPPRRTHHAHGGNRLPRRCRAASLSPPGGKRAVTGTIEAEKAASVRDAQALADQQTKAAERVALHRFIAELYEHVPPSDVAARSPEDLCGAALALWRFGAERQRGSAKVRVYNPTSRDGWSSPHTI